MKKLVCALFLCIMAVSASAQVKFESVQGNINLRGDVGLGVGTTIALPKNHSVTPSLNLYFPSGMSHFFTIDVDGHYDFDLGNEFHAYPIGGISLMSAKSKASTIMGGDDDITIESVSVTRLGINLGGGLDYDLDYNWTVFGELKYQIMSDYGHLLLAAGVKYRF